MHEITKLLLAWKSGDKEAFDRLQPLVDPQLKRIARNYLRDDRARNRLKTNTLVHEALIRLIKENLALRDRKQFYAFVARRMRQVLIDEARKQDAAKRGNRPEQVGISEAHDVPAKSKSREVVMLDEALADLAKQYKRKAEVVEYRFFIGLSAEEAAEVMGLSLRTIERDWDFAQAWLKRYLTNSDKRD
jgi:RNA polymerase sigma factor (TIGR02999 family)